MKTHSHNTRLPKPYGCLIDRNQAIEFEFEGHTVVGYKGDSIASALIAEQQWVMSRSFKYHRPRGPLTFAGHDANTMVQLPSAPNSLADKVNIEAGLKVTGQNYLGSLRRDWMSTLGAFSRFLPVAFYYKAFFWPRGVWPLWAKLFRPMAGLGVIDQSHHSGEGEHIFDKQYKFADVAIIGAGPAGLSAALSAAKAGADVLLIDENSRLGGSLNYSQLAQPISQEESRNAWQQKIAEVEQHPNIEILLNTSCNSWQADNWLALVSRRRLYKLRAKQLILCTGSIEQPALFRGNDLPGVMMSSAALRLVHLYGVIPGQRLVILAGNDEAYDAALELHTAGINIAAVVEMRPQLPNSSAAMLLQEEGIGIHTNSTVYEAKLDAKTQRVGQVEVREIVAPGECASRSTVIDCDALCMSVGFMPSWQLPCMAGAQLSYNDENAQFSLNNLPQNMHLAGSVAGRWLQHEVAEHGAYVGSVAAGNDATQSDFTEVALNHPWPIFPHPSGKEFVDFDEDLQIADIVNATRDGYSDIQLVKRYSTCGMGPSQGRHSALAAARIVAKATGRTVAQTGVTTARPPVAAEPLAINAGRSFYPVRRTNMHYRHLEAGAQMMQAGAWYRPAFYGKAKDSESAISSEVAAVRNNVAVIDVSTLGGLEVRGPDAAEFLNRFYTFAFVKLAVGQSRYALLTNEAGVVIDDGVAARLHEQHFYVTATTGGVDRVFQSMLKWNTQWGLDVDIANATTAWCGMNIAGPKSRAVLQQLESNIDLSNDAFPYMAAREGVLGGIPVRMLRVGFVGELGFEIHAPQQYGEALWDMILETGKTAGIRPFGVEAQRVLRLEKGHVIIGQDTDAMSNPMELQMGWAIARKKPFFVGARTLRELEQRPIERVLVGFTLPNDVAAQPKESCLVLNGEQMVGRVTSCNYSPTKGHIIGLAYVPLDQSATGTAITIKCEGNIRVVASVCELPFYDSVGERQAL